MLIVHFIGLAMGVGTSFAFLFLGMASARLEKTEAQRFKLNTLFISRMGHIGLALLIVSGGYLMTPYWKAVADTPLLLAKLVLVVILAVGIGIIGSLTSKAKIGDAETHLRKIESFGKLTFLIGLAIVVLAVYVFH